MRDIAYQNRVNPITQIDNRGLVVFGQKSLSPISSALDRINVVRLLCKMKYDLNQILQPFLFEINDSITRASVQNVVNRYLAGIKALRGLYDYAVVCDESNNTAARIDANELWVDVAIKPAKVIEFIYVPISVVNTGDSLTNVAGSGVAG
jgi:phage tail sheath protein FI